MWYLTIKMKKREKMRKFRTMMLTTVSILITASITPAFSQDKADIYFSKGMEKFSERSYDSALYFFNLAIEERPDFADAYFRRGLTQDELGNSEQALTDYNKAISIKPMPVYYNNLAMMNVRIGKFEEAMNLYNKAIDLDSNYLVAIYNKGRLYLEMENTTEGCYYMKKAYFKGLTVVEDAINYFCN